jgi:hypothetical protein
VVAARGGSGARDLSAAGGDRSGAVRARGPDSAGEGGLGPGAGDCSGWSKSAAAAGAAGLRGEPRGTRRRVGWAGKAASQACHPANHARGHPPALALALRPWMVAQRVLHVLRRGGWLVGWSVGFGWAVGSWPGWPAREQGRLVAPRGRGPGNQSCRAQGVTLEGCAAMPVSPSRSSSFKAGAGSWTAVETSARRTPYGDGPPEGWSPGLKWGPEAGLAPSPALWAAQA